jgi:PAS domain S-box-containing protein
MVSRRLKITSIKSRLRLISIFSLLIFLLTTVTVVSLLVHLHRDIDQRVGIRFEQALTNSQNRSDFGLLVERLGVFRNTFYGNQDLVGTEGQALETLIGQLAGRVADPEQRQLLYHLQEEYHAFLVRVFWINFTFLQRRWQEEEIDELLLFNSERLTQNIGQGRTSDDFMETFVLLRQLRVGFQRLSNMFFALDRSHEAVVQSLDNQAIIAALEPLNAAARQVANEPFPHHLTGRELLSRIDHMAYLLQQHQREMQLLREQGDKLDALTERIMVAMQVLDQQISIAVGTARKDIGDTLYVVFVGSLVGCFVLISAVLLGHRWLFTRHVEKPMELVGRRLQAFQQGDHSTLMQLGRSDEWQRIELVFNDMLGNLEKSLGSLRDSERRYREIFTNATEGIFRASLDGRFLALNPAAVAMLGHVSEAEAMDYYSDLSTQLYPDPLTRSRLLEGLRASGKNINFEAQIVRADGSLFWAAINNHLVYNAENNVPYIEGTVQDITARRSAQSALQELKSFLQRIIDSMPSVLIAVDAELKVILWNSRAEQECRLQSSQARGGALKDVLCLVKYEVVLAKLQSALASQKPVRLQKIEGCGLVQGGAKRHYYDILIYPLPSVDEGGAVIHIDDVTEQVALEQILIQKEKMESVAGLAAGFAHELNNPLAVILQSAQVLERRLSPEFSKNCETAVELGTSMTVIAAYLQQKKCDTMITSIAEAGVRAAKIVENIQTFSRRSGSDFSRHSVNDLVERALDLAVSDYDMRRHLKFQRIRIVRDYQTVPEVVCDSAQMQQIILILLKNAAQALVAVQDNPQITLRIEGKDEYVCLEVRDNGTGMPPDVCRRVFDPFYTTQDVGRGVGLGLSIAHHIITQNHRGFMSVSSEAGAGSSFEVYLPTLNTII